MFDEGGWWIPAAMIAMSALKNQEQKKAAKEQNNIAAMQTEFGSWTGKGAGKTTRAPSTIGALAQGAASGMSMQQGYDKFNAGQAAAKGGGNVIPLRSMNVGNQPTMYSPNQPALSNAFGQDTHLQQNPWFNYGA